MRIIDISWPVSPSMTEYKDRRTVAFTQVKTIEQNGARESAITLNVHTGTHVDAPSHFLPDGKTIDQTSLSLLVGRCLVLDCIHIQGALTAQNLEPYKSRIEPGDIVLLKTKNSDLSATAPFDTEFVFLEASGARFLVDAAVKAIGIDYLGIERGQVNHDTHEIVLAKGIPIIEGLRLKDVIPGRYQAVIAPLLLHGLDAAPARAFLMQE